MTTRRQRRKRTFIQCSGATVTMGGAGANKAFIEKIYNLHDIVEGIVSADGQRALCSKVRLHFYVDSDDGIFGIQGLAIQTAGTITDTIDLTSDIIDENLNDCIDDVFGYQTMSNFTLSRKVPEDTAVSGGTNIVRTSMEVPGNLLQLLNKEVETERLQDLSIALYGKARANNQVFIVNFYVEVEFTVVNRNIIQTR